MRLFIWRVMIAIGLGLFVTVRASAIGNKAAPEPLQALLMMSDTHFNPFYDPAKVKQLAEAPANRWEDILASPDSPTQTQDFEALRMGCVSCAASIHRIPSLPRRYRPSTATQPKLDSLRSAAICWHTASGACLQRHNRMQHLNNIWRLQPKRSSTRCCSCGMQSGRSALLCTRK